MIESTYIATLDPHAVGGPLLNAFSPAERKADDRTLFFRPDESPPPPGDEDAERWDGLG